MLGDCIQQHLLTGSRVQAGCSSGGQREAGCGHRGWVEGSWCWQEEGSSPAVAGRCRVLPGSHRQGHCRGRAERPAWCRAVGCNCPPGTVVAAVPGAAAAAAARGRWRPGLGQPAGCRPGTAGLAARGFAADCSLLERQRARWVRESKEPQALAEIPFFCLFTATNTEQLAKHRTGKPGMNSKFSCLSHKHAACFFEYYHGSTAMLKIFSTEWFSCD